MNTYDKSADTAVLVVSFGTSYNDSRDITIGAVEKAIAKACPGYEARRAFTSQTIINILRDREGIKIDNVAEALKRAAADGIRNLAVQPTHIMDGFEYNEVMRQLDIHRDSFCRIAVGRPLLWGEEDFRAVAKAAASHTGVYDDGETAVIYIGHGTMAESNRVYGRLQSTFADERLDNYYIGTVEAGPAAGDLAKILRERGRYRRVVLTPLMLVAGDHANNDMAGDGKDSWKSVFMAEGYQVECLLQGLGELEAIRELYVNHALAAVEGLR